MCPVTVCCFKIGDGEKEFLEVPNGPIEPRIFTEAEIQELAQHLNFEEHSWRDVGPDGSRWPRWNFDTVTLETIKNGLTPRLLPAPLFSDGHYHVRPMLLRFCCPLGLRKLFYRFLVACYATL